MNITMVTVTVYFVGIAAIVNAPPHNNVTKSVIFPATPGGITYNGVALAQHEVFLYLRGDHVVTEDLARTCEKTLGGKLQPNQVCKVPLNGAKLWTLSSQDLIEDQFFQKVPSFSTTCEHAKDLPEEYTGEPSQNPVAARFDITGGTVSACNRNHEAFVTTLKTDTNDSALYVQQGERTMRIAFKQDTVIAVENRPVIQAGHVHDPKSHFGWYYYMNKRAGAEHQIDLPARVDGPPVCNYILGADDNYEAVPMMAASADCSNSNYP